MPLLPLLFLLLAGAGSAAVPGNARPNIVVILADDLGYGDPSCYNPERGRIRTPHLDRLAREGARFTDGHASSAACSPSRYTLLTGRYHWRTRLQTGIVDLWERPLIAPDRLTIAGLARRQGYRTAAFGKWHLGWDWPLEEGDLAFLRGLGGRAGRSRDPLLTEPTAEHRRVWSRVFSQAIAGGPVTRGFEHYFGTDVPNWPPYSFIADDRTVGLPSTLLPARLMEGFRASFQGPALPGWEFESVLDTTIARAEAYVAERARNAEPFLLYVALTTPHTPISPSRAWQGRSGLNDYADLVLETDDAIGRLLAALDRHGLARDTFVLCTSDNGYETAIGIKPLEAMGHFPSGPLRGYKRDAWEGGHRVPFLVR
jgi:arylsulfatase A-like enzyme